MTKLIFKAAHRIAKELKKEFNDIDYKAQVAINIKFLNEQNKKGNNEMLVKYLNENELKSLKINKVEENTMKNTTAIKNKENAIKSINERLADLESRSKLFGSMKQELPELKQAKEKLENGFIAENEDKFWSDVPECGLAWDWAKKING